MKSENKSRTVLHVLTYIGSHGEYGGPLTVARNISNDLTLRNTSVTVIGATSEEDFDGDYENHKEIRIKSRIHIQKYRYSSIFSKKLLYRIFKEVKKNEVIHVHFARDLVPIIAAILAIFFRKKLVLQSHGMIRKDFRIVVRIVDIIVKRIAVKASAFLILTNTELQNLREVGIKSRFILFRNGLPALEALSSTRKKNKNKIKIIFLARLSLSKRPQIVVEIANQLRISYPELHFTIYGPDDGALLEVIDLIKKLQISDYVDYGGALTPTGVLKAIRECDLVLLPSLKDPYPMVVLETLRLGKPIIVSPDCGQAELLRGYDSRLVSDGFRAEDYIHKIKELLVGKFPQDLEMRMLEIFSNEFEISSLGNRLAEIYFDE